MKQPDRFARVAERLYLHVGSEGKIPYPHVEKLLRAEHRAVMKLVEKQPIMAGKNEDGVETIFCTINKRDLLAALKRRAR